MGNNKYISIKVFKGIPEKFEGGGKELHETISPVSSSYEQFDETLSRYPDDKIFDSHVAYVPDITADISTQLLSNNNYSPIIFNRESADFKFDGMVPNEWNSEISDHYQPSNLTTDGNTVNCSFLTRSDDEASQLGVGNQSFNLLKNSEYSNLEVEFDEASDKIFELESALASKPESELMSKRVAEALDMLTSVATSQLVFDPALETDALLASEPDAETGVEDDELLTEVPTNTYDDAVDEEVYLDCCEDYSTWASEVIGRTGACRSCKLQLPRKV